MLSSAATNQATTFNSSSVLSKNQRITSSLRDRLQQSPYLVIRTIACEFRDGIAILHGTVPTYYTRQIAIAVAHGVDGVRELDDRIQVSDRQKGK